MPDDKEVSYERDPKIPEFFGFTRGNTVFSLSKGGGLVSRSLKWPEEPATTATDSVQISLPFGVGGLAEEPFLPVGLTVISGRTGGGKSSFVRALATMMQDTVDVVRLLTVEPHDTGEEVAELTAFSSADGALAAAIAGHYAPGRARPVLYAIDSLRGPLFETSGAAGSKGISMPFFTQITRVSNCLAKAGISVIATINPMDEDKAYVDSFISKLSASVPAFIELEPLTTVGGETRFSGSLRMRPKREPRSFSFSVGDDVPTIRVEELSFESPSTTVTRNRPTAMMIEAIQGTPL